MAESLIIGIDTSCYTTSLAVKTGDNIIQAKKMLDVKVGERGLRQSDALFQHIKNLPVLFDDLKEKINFSGFDKVVVSVSTKPRSVEGSYMPVFLAGHSFARVVADVLGGELVETSHQDGHIMAAIYSCGKYDICDEPFLVYHLSGGTTELLLAKKNGNSFECEIIGGTKDLPAGQFVDRIGVKMGIDFPCGKQLDSIATKYSEKKPKVPICVMDGYINFSGEETRYSRMVKKGEECDKVAYCVMKCISKSVKASVEFALEKYGVKNVLMVGGVSSSEMLREEFSLMSNVFFAKPEFSTDNAAGVCEIGSWWI